MEVKLERKIFREAWEGDEFRPGDNIRSMEWEGYLVTIIPSPEEESDPFINQVSM